MSTISLTMSPEDIAQTLKPYLVCTTEKAQNLLQKIRDLREQKQPTWRSIVVLAISFFVGLLYSPKFGVAITLIGTAIYLRSAGNIKKEIAANREALADAVEKENTTIYLKVQRAIDIITKTKDARLEVAVGAKLPKDQNTKFNLTQIQFAVDEEYAKNLSSEETNWKEWANGILDNPGPSVMVGSSVIETPLASAQFLELKEACRRFLALKASSIDLVRVEKKPTDSTVKS